jgi:heme o synthase
LATYISSECELRQQGTPNPDLDGIWGIEYIWIIFLRSFFVRTNPVAGSIPVFQISWAKAGDFLKLTKPKLLSLVLFVTLAGFCAATPKPVPMLRLLHTLIGTALIAGGATAFNMYRERKFDALMQRTAFRPLAAGRLKSKQALIFSLTISAAGFAYLYILVNHPAGLLSAATFAGYVFLYTPLKTKTWLCTFVGAVPGALPAVVGWTAANASISPHAWILFAIVFLWQIPHFHAIGWMHRDEYVRAGMSVLSVIDVRGNRTSRQVLFFIAALMLFTLLPFFVGLSGPFYLAGSTALGITFLGFAVNFARSRTQHSARELFVASAFYLPALFGLLVIEKLVA